MLWYTNYTKHASPTSAVNINLGTLILSDHLIDWIDNNKLSSNIFIIYVCIISKISHKSSEEIGKIVAYVNRIKTRAI